MSRNRKQGRNKWVEDLATDFGGFGGFTVGTVIMLYGAFSGKEIMFAGGAIFMAIAGLVTVVEWFTRE
jgi:hypothetical protein